MIDRETAQEILNQLPGQLEEPRLLLVGVGGAGINILRAVESEAGFRKVALDTDDYSLALSQVPRQIHLRTTLPHGTGGDPDIGRAAARRHREEIRTLLEGDIVLLAAGLGGGTGTGVAPVVARLAQEGGLPVLAFLAWPFQDEDVVRQAHRGLEATKANCDGLLVLDNEAAFALTEMETRRDAAEAVNEAMGRVLRDLQERVRDAFVFSVREELADFLESLPSEDVGLPIRDTGWDSPRDGGKPLPVDPRGIVELR
jgi:cell division protein FtsZ